MHVTNVLIFSFIYLCILKSDIFYYIFHVVCELQYDTRPLRTRTSSGMCWSCRCFLSPLHPLFLPLCRLCLSILSTSIPSTRTIVAIQSTIFFIHYHRHPMFWAIVSRNFLPPLKWCSPLSSTRPYTWLSFFRKTRGWLVPHPLPLSSLSASDRCVSRVGTTKVLD